MTAQLELPIARKAPKCLAAEVEELIVRLRGQGWMSAAQLGAERKVRALANASGGRILSWPGSPGYCLTREAQLAEIETAVAKLRHQAIEMDRRATEINRVRHAHFSNL